MCGIEFLGQRVRRMEDRKSEHSRFRRMRKRNPRKRAQGLRNYKAIPRARAWQGGSIKATSNMTLRAEISRLSKLMLPPLHPISADRNLHWLITHPA
jgi:hypothetical protein